MKIKYTLILLLFALPVDAGTLCTVEFPDEEEVTRHMAETGQVLKVKHWSKHIGCHVFWAEGMTKQPERMTPTPALPQRPAAPVKEATQPCVRQGEGHSFSRFIEDGVEMMQCEICGMVKRKDK